MDNNLKSVKKFLETGSREVVDVSGDVATFEITVKKNAGKENEMVDTITVSKPITVDGLLAEYGENTIIKDVLRVELADLATAHRKNRMVSEEERQAQIEKDKKKVQKKIDQLKQAGLDMAEIKELIQ